MIEIVFSDSAKGSLVLAQSYGAGKYRGGCIGVLLSHSDGSEPSQEEIDEFTRKAEENSRRSWEQAVPLGGKPGDVFGFSMGLSVGDIHDPMDAETRTAAFQTLLCQPDDYTNQQYRDDLNMVRSRLERGENARIWYSDAPDEACGFYWLMNELRNLPPNHGTLYAVKLPQQEEAGDRVHEYNSWGNIGPGEFHRFTPMAQPISDNLCRYYSNLWVQLQEENAPLRAMVNGKLRSVTEDFYDSFIRAEIDRQGAEFWEPLVICNVLDRYQLGIGDGLIHSRIEAFVRAGLLEVSQPPEADDIGYRRKLRKKPLV